MHVIINRIYHVSLQDNVPPKAPETVAAEKNIAARIPNSERLYQLPDNQSNLLSEHTKIIKCTRKDNSRHPGKGLPQTFRGAIASLSKKG